MYQYYCIIGNTFKDAVLRRTQDGDPVLSFRVITSKKVKGKQYSFGIEASLRGPLAESLAPYMKKGQRVLAAGELETQSWDEGGEKKYATKLRAETARLMGGENRSTSAGDQHREAGHESDHAHGASHSQQQQQRHSRDPFADPFADS